MQQNGVSPNYVPFSKSPKHLFCKILSGNTFWCHNFKQTISFWTLQPWCINTIAYQVHKISDKPRSSYKNDWKKSPNFPHISFCFPHSCKKAQLWYLFRKRGRCWHINCCVLAESTHNSMWVTWPAKARSSWSHIPVHEARCRPVVSNCILQEINDWVKIGVH